MMGGKVKQLEEDLLLLVWDACPLQSHPPALNLVNSPEPIYTPERKEGL